MTAQEAERILEETAAKLGEHFEAVQILGTWSEGGVSMCSKRGSGNFYARIGMVREFMEMQTADTFAIEIANRSTQEPE